SPRSWRRPSAVVPSGTSTRSVSVPSASRTAAKQRSVTSMRPDVTIDAFCRARGRRPAPSRKAAHDLVDVALAAEVQRRALVQLARGHVEDALPAVAGGPAGALADERERRVLVQQAQLAFRLRDLARVHVDAALQQRAVEV